MNLKQLRYFVVLAETLHFRRAAERLNITQSPLSIAIQSLEAEIGAPLFHRTQRQVRLTEVGLRLLDHAGPLLARMEHAERDVRDLAAGKIGQLRIGFTAASSLLSPFPALISAFRRRFPEIEVILRDQTSLAQIESIASRDLDVGLLRRPSSPVPDAVSTRRLATDRLVVAMPRDHRLHDRPGLTIADLAGEDFIFFPRRMGVGIHDQILELCRKRGFAPRIVQEGTEATTIVGLVAAGLGIAILPAGLRYIRIPNILFRDLADEDAVTELLLAFRAGEADAKVSQLLHLAQAAFARSGDPDDAPGTEGDGAGPPGGEPAPAARS